MRILLALLLLAPVAVAQLTTFGDQVPLTDTRYGAFGGAVKLVSAGADAYMFWEHGGRVRMARVIPGVNRVSRPVLDIHGTGFDVVWTGSHFVVAGTTSGNSGTFVVTRAVRADGDPVAPAHVLLDARGDTPRLAFNGSEVMLVYRRGANSHAAILEPDGSLSAALTQPIVYGAVSDTVSLASDGARFLVMTAAADRIKFTTVTRHGAVSGAFAVSEDFMAGREAALASDGEEFLAVWRESASGSLVMLDVRPGGTPRIVPETERATSPSVLLGADGRVHLAYLQDGSFHVQDGFGNDRVGQTPAGEGATSLASMNGHVISAWPGRDRTILTRDLDDPASRGRQAAFGTAEQEILATASRPDAALIVWSESDGTIHAGIRRSSGSWTEGKIGEPGESAIAAASHGAQFAVLKKTASGGTALTMIDDFARVAGQTPELPFRGMDVTASGSSYAVGGVNAAGDLVVALVSASGTAQPPRVVATRLDGHDIENVRVASNGSGYLAVWQDTYFEMCFPVCNPYVSEIRAIEVDEQLLAVDGASPLPIASDPATLPDVAWDGDRRYVLVWNRGGALETRSVRLKTLTSVVRIEGIALGPNAPRAVHVRFSVAVTFGLNQVVLLREGVEVERRMFDGPLIRNDAAVALGHRIDYLQTLERDEMPYHGARRIFVRTAESSGPGPAPGTPRLAVHGTGPMHVSWTAAANNVNGYRVEYSVNDGAWNELDEWFDRDELSFSIEPWIAGAEYRFRVRALNFWGSSGYSNEATPRTTKRRSVR